MKLSQITKIRLVNQKLIGSDFKTPEEVVSWMGAVQAQDYNMGKWAVGTRLPGSTDTMVGKAIDEGKIIRMHILRPTWHLVSAEDIHWMIKLSSERLKITLRSSDAILGLTEKIIGKVNDVMREVLKGGNHLTRQEIGEHIERSGIPFEERGLNHLMYHAELNGVVCNGVVRGNKITYGLLEERVADIHPYDKDQALEKLARKYFMSHAPATVHDFGWWSGLSVTDCRKAIEMIKSDLLSEKIDGREYWINNSFTEINYDDNEVHLLPAWDEYTVSYKDRTDIVTSDNHGKVMSKNGLFKPTILWNGQIIGAWRKVSGKKDVVVETDLFVKGNKALRNKIEEAIAVYSEFKKN